MPLEQRRRQREILSSGWCRNKRRKLSGKCKSKRYIIMGACFSCLHPLSSFIIFFSKGDCPTVVSFPPCFTFHVLGGWELWACVCQMFTHQLRSIYTCATAHTWIHTLYVWVCLLPPRASWRRLWLRWLFTHAARLPAQSHVLFFCVIPVLSSLTCADLFKTTHRNSVFSFDLDNALPTHLCVQVAFLFFLQSECSSMTQIKPHHLSTHPSFFPFHFPPISLPSLFPPHDTAVLAGLWWGFRNGNEMHGMVALCQRAADWTLAWMVQQMFADFFYSN